MRFSRAIEVFLFLLSGILLSGCGISAYPGQPGVVTNNYSKIDMESLQADGLFVYEAIYDNRPGGKGVGAIITKLYPKAQTNTSNVRTNADGTLYRVKAQYDGAEVQMIAIPSLGQVHMAPNSKVQFLISYKQSLDEVDDKNIAEEHLFKPVKALAAEAMRIKTFRWDLLKAGRLLPNGNLSYEVTALGMDAKQFVPSKPVLVETNLFQNSLRTNLTIEQRTEALQFLETNFPKGYQGVVKIQLKGATQPFPVRLGIHSVKTAQAAGMQIMKDASTQMAREVAEQFEAGQL